MNKLVFNVHSTVDLITNSSSELFVIDNKTVDVVKDILYELADSGRYPGITRENLFRDIVDEPKAVGYSIPDSPLRSKATLYYVDANTYSDSFLTPEIKSAIKEADRCLDSVNSKYSKYAIAACFVGFHARFVETMLAYFRECCDVNGMDYNIALSGISFSCWGERIYMHSHFNITVPDTYPRFIEAFLGSMDANIPYNDTTIELASKLDNSIPYELMEEIAEIFKALRIHS